MDIKSFFQASFASKKVAFYLNLLGLTLAFTIFYILMSEVKWVNGFDAFHKDADRVYRVHHHNGLSPHFPLYWMEKLQDYAPEASTVVAMDYIRGGENAISPIDSTMGTDMIDAYFCYTTENLTKVFTFDMIEGSGESITDPTNALIPLSLAKKLYGKNESYVGRVFKGDMTYFLTVGGVYKDFPSNSVMKNVVYQAMDENIYNRNLADKSNYCYTYYARLQKGVDPKSIYKNFLYDNRELFNLSDSEETDIDDFTNIHTMPLIPLHDVYFLPKNIRGGGGSYYMNILFLTLALFIIVIASINFMNFSMAMVPYRIKAINMKKILGARSLSLRYSLLLESFLTIFTALIIALILLNILIKGGFLTGYLKSDIAFDKNITLLIYLGLLTILITLFAGFYPAYYMTSRKPAWVVNGSFTLSGNGRVFRKGLIGIQFTVSLIVIITMLLMNSQNFYIRNSPVGYARDSILYVQSNHDFRTKYYDAFINELHSNTDITNIAWSEFILGETDGKMSWGNCSYGEKKISFMAYPVQPNFLRTQGIEIKEGRDFRQEDANRETGVYIFNEAAKKKYDLELNTTISRGHLGGYSSNSNGEIIGFISDIRFGTFKTEVAPMAFYVWGTKNWGVRDYNCAIRVIAPDKIPEIRRFIESTYEKLTGEQATQLKFYSKEDIAEIAYVEEDKQIRMVLAGSIISLLISIIGVFGLVLFETQAKRKEIGVRKVFGAFTKDILLMFNKQYLNTLIICFVIATPISYYLYTIWVENFAYQIPTQWWLFAVAFLIVAIVVCGTVTIQSWRAARELPVNVLHK